MIPGRRGHHKPNTDCPPEAFLLQRLISSGGARMMRRFILVSLIFLVVPRALAQDKPDGVPDAKPAPEVSADEAALRAALKALSKALQDGDAKAIHQAIYAANATERKMVDAMSSMATQIAQLYRTSVKAFGEEQAKGLTGDMGAEMSRIDEAKVSIEGDTATVRYEKPEAAKTESAAPDPATPDPADAPDDPDDAASSPPPPMVLKKVEGRWQVPVSELSKDTTPEEIEQRLADLALQTKVIAELSGEIAEGKYKTADKAAEAWQAKMMQALTPPRKAEPAKDDKQKPETKGE